MDLGHRALGEVEGEVYTIGKDEKPRRIDVFRPWMEAFLTVANHYRLAASPQSIELAAHWLDENNEESSLREIARRVQLSFKFAPEKDRSLSSWLLPMIAEFKSGEIGVVTAISEDGSVGVIFSHGGGMETPLSLDTLSFAVKRFAYLRPLQGVKDHRVSSYNTPYDPKWLQKLLLHDLRPYSHVMVGSFIANFLGLATIIFSMQVYDRVIPAQSVPTLWVLFSGVILAIAIDFIVRKMRSTIIDLLGKRADLRLSDLVMGRALRVKTGHRPASTGTFISQLRELESVREMLTSTTVSALSDFPFFILFLVAYALLCGPLVVIPIVAVIVMILPGILLQSRLKTLSNLAMRESSLRNAMLVEAVQGIDDIKSLQAEDRFQQYWNHLNAETGDANIKTRQISSFLSIWTQCTISLAFASTILIGAPLVISGDLTTGTLIAASMLGSRMLAPMAQATLVLTRLQQARNAAKGLNQIMQLPIDNPPDESRIHVPNIRGDYQISNAVFRYGGKQNPVALKVPSLNIQAGEKIAIVGRNGAGKSTLLKALAGYVAPDGASMRIDSFAMRHIDPMDIRRDVMLLSQNARLFHGSLRDNIIMGAPMAQAQDIAAALDITGANEWINELPKGLDTIIFEGGESMSGGQRQLLLLTRTLIRNPNVILLDEPTSALDETSERLFLNNFKQWSKTKTVVIATHRMKLLDLVDRVIVVDKNKLVLDRSKKSFLEQMRGSTSAARAPITVIEGGGNGKN